MLNEPPFSSHLTGCSFLIRTGIAIVNTASKQWLNRHFTMSTLCDLYSIVAEFIDKV
jgi:hypothetical protein